jgi:hypothetical protein
MIVLLKTKLDIIKKDQRVIFIYIKHIIKTDLGEKKLNKAAYDCYKKNNLEY